MQRIPGKAFKVGKYIGLQHVRHQSQQPGQHRSGVGGAIFGVVAAATVGLSGVMGYAAWNEQNRKDLDENIPGFSYVTDSLLGPVKSVPSSPLMPTVTPIIPKPAAKKPATDADKDPTDTSLMKKKLDREKKKEEEEKDVTEGSQVNAPASPALAPPTAPEVPQPTASPPAATAASPLGSVVRDATRGVTAALQAAEDAAAVVQQQAASALQTIESPGEMEESIMMKVVDAISAAEQALDAALESVTVLSGSISKCEDKSCAEVVMAEKTAAELVPALAKVKSVIKESLSTILNVEKLCSILQEARTTLSAELAVAMPGLPEFEAERKLQLMLGHAYNRITLLQRQILDKQKALDELRARGGVAEEGGVTESVLQSELDRLRHQLNLQHRSDLSRQHDELEAEVRGQLKRQAAAYADHLSDVLTKQQHELTLTWQAKLYDDINKEKDRHYRDLATVKGRLLGLQSAVSARAVADGAARNARELWLACQSLRNALRLGREDASTWDQQLQPLQGHITAITVAAGGEDEFVSSISASVGSVALERGVYTEQALRHRFHRVECVARRVAMVPENGGSLLRYLLSYLQSALLVQASPAPTDAELLDQPVDVHSLTTFDILRRARVCLAADDMLACVRWVNQLTGESRRVASDWCNEARRTLEARQAAEALMAHAAAVTATAVLY